MTNNSGRVVAAATDGACSGNPGPGGWGALLRFEDGTIEEFGGFEPRTTNNRMELQAAIAILERLRQLRRHPNLTIRTDSKYLINGLSQWMDKWKEKGWRTSTGKPVLNQDLWKKLDHAQIADIRLEYVKGHSGDPDNDRVDKIAVGFSKGNPLKLEPEKDLCLKNTKPIEAIGNSKAITEATSPSLQKLLSKLDIADHFANKGYCLSTAELAELVNKPIEQLEKKMHAWQWRDWLVEPIEKSKWRLQSLKQKRTAPRDEKHDK